MKRITISLLFGILFAVSACSTDGEPTPALPTAISVREAPTATLTPMPSATPLPSPTLTPSSTPTPSVTPTLTRTPTTSPTPDWGPERIEIGRSFLDSPINAVRFGFGPNRILFVGGLHAGFSPGSVSLARRSIAYFTENPQAVPATVTVYVIESANPDSAGGAAGSLSGRLNGNGVDLNRNWPCRWRSDPRWSGSPRPGLGGDSPYSEPEASSLRAFIVAQQPAAVVFWQARVPNGLVSAGSCGQQPIVSAALGQIYGQAAGYPVADFEDVVNPVSGDAANSLDQEGIPATAVLLPDYGAVDWEKNLDGMLAVISVYGN